MHCYLTFYTINFDFDYNMIQLFKLDINRFNCCHQMRRREVKLIIISHQKARHRRN